MDHSRQTEMGQGYIHTHNMRVPPQSGLPLGPPPPGHGHGMTPYPLPPPPHFRRSYSTSTTQNITPSSSTIIKTKNLTRTNSHKRKQENFSPYSSSYPEQRHYDDSTMFKRRMTSISYSHDTAEDERNDGDETRDAAPSSPSGSTSLEGKRDGQSQGQGRLVHRQVKRVGSSELASAMALASLAYGNSEAKREESGSGSAGIPSRQSSFSDVASMRESGAPLHPTSQVSQMHPRPHPKGYFVRSYSDNSSYGSFGHHAGRNTLLLQEHMNRPLHGYNRRFDAYYEERQGPPITSSNSTISTIGPPTTNTMAMENNKKQWVCDFCNKESFPTYEEACRHEEQCSFNPRASNYSKVHIPIHIRGELGDGTSSDGKNRLGASVNDDVARRGSEQIRSHQNKPYFEGVIPLSVPVTDSDWLSETNCFIRRECVEAFSAKEGDIMVSSKRGRISLQQVGIRCKFCSGEEAKNRGSGAVSFPVSVSGIYESVKRWKSVHLAECKCIPEEVKEKIKSMEKSSCVPTTRQYWIDSAKALGIDDTIDGLRFVSDPHKANRKDAQESMIKTRFAPSWAKKSKSQSGDDEKDKYIVFPSDKPTITPFVYCLMRQVQPCVFTEADRFLSRSKSKVGFAGFECRHCNGHAGLGRYFPSTPKALSTNSTSQNIYSHIQKCRKCPQEVKDELKNIKLEKPTWLRRTCGWRQAFFALLWERLHG